MKRSRGELRIIGGTLRGRRLPLVEAPGLRPTPDRVRETLFNWLAPHIAGTRVLDLFAGSGALGFEALSRGAASAILVEQDRGVLAVLRDSAARFAPDAAQDVAGEALAFLAAQRAHQFDVALLDPPFDSGLLEPALQMLATRDVLAPGGWCYVEHAADAAPTWPAGWRLHRSGHAGAVGYHLLHAPPRDLPRDV